MRGALWIVWHRPLKLLATVVVDINSLIKKFNSSDMAVKYLYLFFF